MFFKVGKIIPPKNTVVGTLKNVKDVKSTASSTDECFEEAIDPEDHALLTNLNGEAAHLIPD